MTLILSNAEVAEVVSMKDCIDSLEDAFLELAEGRGAFRRRSDICTPSGHESGGMYALKSMDGVVPKLGVAAIRLISKRAEEQGRGHELPTDWFTEKEIP